MKLHRLLAITFIPNPLKLHTIDHSDRNKTNNSLSNLRWASSIEQNRHSKPKVEGSKIPSRPVWKCDKITSDKLKLYCSGYAAAIDLTGNKKSSCVIASAASGKLEQAHGYKWQYTDETFNGEIWKDIHPEILHGKKGYQISSMGRVKNANGRISSGTLKTDGYVSFSAYPKVYSMHAIMAKTFFAAEEGKTICNHKNGKRNDNQLSNLELVTPSENVLHAIRRGLKKK